jgi:protein-S-isoprenylcysteine O-methyltransferase Ste14
MNGDMGGIAPCKGMIVTMNDLSWRARQRRARFYDRLASAGLSVFLGVTGVLQLARMVTEFRDGHHLLAVYQVLIGLSSMIMALLVLIRGPKIASGSGVWPRVVATIGSFIVLPIAFFPVKWDVGWLLLLTSGLLIISYVWIIWALLTLKRSFSVFPEARALITHGPYAIVRHPLYAAYFITYVCAVLPRASVVAWAIVFIGIAAELMRSKNEERVLRSAFPDYDAYARRVPAFFPLASTRFSCAKLASGPAAQPSTPQS